MTQRQDPQVIVFHELKEWAELFAELWSKERKHEIRRDDREIAYAAGHIVKISEYAPHDGLNRQRMKATGRWVQGMITSITRGVVGSNANLPPGICVFTFMEHGRGGSDANDSTVTPPDRGRA